MGRIAPGTGHQPHLLPAVSHRAGESGDLALSGLKETGPFVGVVRKADPQQVLRVPFGRERSFS